MNTFGHIFRLTSFGESHGPAMGGVIDGMPAGVPIDLAEIQRQLDRRRPGQSPLTTQRDESDDVEVLSGIFEGKTLGTPIGFIIRNKDVRSDDYEHLRNIYRPSHADYTCQMKYGVRDHRGGGRASARETASRVVAGAFAMQVLKKFDVSIKAYVSQIGDVALTAGYQQLDLSITDNNDVKCPDGAVAEQMVAVINEARSHGDTLGGRVTCVVQGVRPGLGEPVAGRLDAELASAMMSIPSAKAFSLGLGAAMSSMRGSEALDPFERGDYGQVQLRHNYSGGILGGISTGDDIYFDVAFKPVPTLMQEMPAIDCDAQPVTIAPRGRHDVCVVPRAVPIVESMAAMVLLDNLLLDKCSRV